MENKTNDLTDEQLKKLHQKFESSAGEGSTTVIEKGDGEIEYEIVKDDREKGISKDK